MMYRNEIEFQTFSLGIQDGRPADFVHFSDVDNNEQAAETPDATCSQEINDTSVPSSSSNVT